MKTFALKVITPKGAVIDKPVSGLYLRGSEGDLAIFAGHVPLVTAVKAGKCTVVYHVSSDDTEAEIGAGMLNITNDKVTLITENWKA